MGDLVQMYINGTTAVKIAQQIEEAVRAGRFLPGHRLPPVRDLARELGVSPATVASAYHVLQSRAVLVANKRRGTRVSHRPMAGAPPTRRRQAVPKGVVDLSDGNPDPAMLPSFGRILHELKYKPRLYGEEAMHTGLIDLMRREMKADGVHVGQCAVVSGTMDGLDRLLAEHLRPGDRVAVEDPGFTGHHDLIASRGLALAPVQVDDQGMLPASLERALREGARAALITLRAQSPTGAAVSPERARELRRRLQRKPETLVIEDDHASFLCEAVACACVHSAEVGGQRTEDRGQRTEVSLRARRRGLTSDLRSLTSVPRWAHLRSFSKSFNPDLRLAVMTGDDQTMIALLDRMVLGERWVSHMLQATAHALLTDKTVRSQVQRAGRTYDERRETLITLLRDAGLEPIGRSGFNIWLNVQEETPTVQALAEIRGQRTDVRGQRAEGRGLRTVAKAGSRRLTSDLRPLTSAVGGAGWAVAAGERFRLSSAPGIRITTSRLKPDDARRFAVALADVLSPPSRSQAV